MNLNTDLEVIKKRIIQNLEIPYSVNRIHGSNECCFENIAFCIGMNQDNLVDDDISAFYEFYVRKLNEMVGIMGSDFVRSIILNGMLFMGEKLNKHDESIEKAFGERLNRVYNFICSGERIFYSDKERKHIKSVPSVWKDTRIVRYEHTNPYLLLTNVYDLLGFSVMYGMNKEIDNKIDRIIDYIFSAYYQDEVKDGYGIAINGEKGFVKSSFYAVGWDVHLSPLTPREEMLYMILFSSITSAKITEWYEKNTEKYLKAIKTGDSQLLSKITSSIRKTYWTSGCYLNFGNSKNKKGDNFIELVHRLTI